MRVTSEFFAWCPMDESLRYYPSKELALEGCTKLNEDHPVPGLWKVGFILEDIHP